MNNKVNYRSNKKKSSSLCEKSMKILVNMLKMSSLSLARVSLGSTSTAATSTSTAPTPASSAGNHGSLKTNLGGSNIDLVGRGGVPPAPRTIPRVDPARLQVKTSQEPAENYSTSKRPSSYLVDPNVGNESSSYVVQEKVISTTVELTKEKKEKASVDNRASNYIQRFHEKNRNDPNNISNSSSSSYIVLPPPPPLINKY